MLYMSNNKIKDWAEIERLAALEDLQEVLLLNNPIQTEIVKGTDGRTAMAEYRVEVRQNRLTASAVNGRRSVLSDAARLLGECTELCLWRVQPEIDVCAGALRTIFMERRWEQVQHTAYLRLQVLRRLPKLKKLDGFPIEVEEREVALKPPGAPQED